MGDENDLLGQYQASRAIVPRSSSPTLVRRQYQPLPLTRARTTTVRVAPVPKLRPPSIKKKGQEKDDGFSFGDILGSAWSAVGYVGGVLKNLPTFGGKLIQTAGGLGELAIDTVLDVPTLFGAPDPFKSRFETDWAEAEKLGLKGWDKWKYAYDRQYPLISPIIESAGMTAGSLGEAATLGALDFGEPGFDYYQALKQGRLGAKLLEDAGNVILIGRMAGAGDIAATAGKAATAAGKPRLGAAVTTAGRIADQPIGEAVRQSARLVGAGARQLGRTSLAESASRVASAVPSEGPTAREAYKAAAAGVIDEARIRVQPGPLRVAINEARTVVNTKAIARFDKLASEIGDLEKQRDSLALDDPKRQVLDDQIRTKTEQMDRTWVLTGLRPKAIKDIMNLQTVAEGQRTQLEAMIAAIKRNGVIPESPESLVEKAARLKEDAAQARSNGDTARADALDADAAYAESLAKIKSENPDAFDGPPPDWASPAAVAILTNQADIVVREVQNGRSFEDIAGLLTSPRATPDLAMRKYRFTAEDVQAIYEYMTGQMSEVNRVHVEVLEQLFRAWNAFFMEAQRRGIGGNNPMPFTYSQNTPDPKFLLAEMRRGKYASRVLKAVEDRLDRATVEILTAILPEVAEQLGFVTLVTTPAGIVAKPKRIKGAFAQVAKLPYEDAAFRLVNVMIAGLYDELLVTAPEVFRDPMIFPSKERDALFTEGRLLSAARAADVDELSASMIRFATQYGDLLGEKRMQKLGQRLTRAVTTPQRFSAKALAAVRQEIVRLLDELQQKREKLAEQGTALAEKEARALERISKAEQELTQLREAMQLIESNPREFLGIDARAADEANVDQRLVQLRNRANVLETLLDSDIARSELEKITAEINDLTLQETLANRPLLVEEKAQLKATLRGTGVVKNAEETPYGVSVKPLRAREAPIEGRLSSGQRAADRTRARLERVREKHAAIDQAEAGLEAGLEGARATSEQLQQPIGPQLTEPGKEAVYLPGGTTAGTLSAYRVPTELRQEGAAPQLKGSYEQMRETDLRPLELTEVGRRLSEVMSQFQRNDIVERIATDPRWASTPTALLGEDAVRQLLQRAEDEVMADMRQPRSDVGLVPNNASADIAQAIRIRFGQLLTEEISRRGYEPVSPVRVNDDGSHEALGTLLQPVSYDKVDGNTYLMKRGMARQITQQFVYQDTGSVNPTIARVLNSVGKRTASWKSYVLPFSLRWQIGDAVSNVLNAWVRGDVPPQEMIAAMRQVVDRLRQQGGDYTRAFEASVNDPVLAALYNAGLQGRGTKLADYMVLKTGSPNLPLEQLQLNGLFRGLRRKGFRVNEMQNAIARTAMAMVRLQDALEATGRTIDEVSPRSYLADPVLRKAVDDSVAATNEALGAFSQLSPFEKNVIRNVYPFWSWLKFINKAAVNLAIDNPERVLLMAHLGSMVSEPDDNGYFDFLQDKIPFMGFWVDASFLNPYEDAIIFSPNPAKALIDTALGVSPFIKTPLQMTGSAAFYAADRQGIPFGNLQRPGYLEGRRAQSARTIGDFLGEQLYLGVRGVGQPFTNVFSLPIQNVPVVGDILINNQGRLRGTDVAFGNVQRYPQGSPRLEGAYGQVRLGPIANVVAAGMRTFGVPGAPIAEQRLIAPGIRLQQRLDRAAQRRREIERRAASL